MLQKIYKYVIVLVVGGAIGAMLNNKHRVEEKVVYKDRTKTIVKERIIENPDGSKVIERETNKTEDKKSVQSRVESKPTQKNWGVGVGYDVFTPNQIISVNVHRRLFSDLYVTVSGRSSGDVTIGATLFF